MGRIKDGRIKDLTNLKFKKLTALKIVDKPDYVKSKGKSAFWLCKCECGNTKIVRSSELIRNDTGSCGCLRKIINFKGYKEIPKSFYNSIKKWNAASRNIEFDISIEYLWELFLVQERKCIYSGEILKFGTSRNDTSRTASLDRIDSSKGYIKGNVVWCHKKINVLKMDLKLNDFYDLCKKVNNYEKESKTVISTIIERDFITE
jgi:hypothetical protein